ncbi:50S ribosomal protein L13 [Candidatus Daviesbacteria bacterium RIFCSPHIGHO2_02_FULL_36_13]|uniref:Large ribosomal subunit protein uL13 n=1 Tax=Candidatus Daviesbacteria bacterium RIFCSPHIGHO2_02_FULL_36_13 TaxID=1797768 RepID=A0A1F5JZ59_9BACT|nr:MAG: 50S ribosomal protein L13 [Candidatus Daviesbacteria bacterium RIFCSPHIGHO2_02_FULL_36_13]OGE44608.1 MAG: 50S ribosomal protein L13 [Candidatus Daviesbacteria bacterium RIFCSPLOWO2_01_FULL_36_8]
MSTNVLSAKDIKREKHIIDASGKILGRLAGEIATLLMGKNKPNFVPYLDNGDFVIVTNASKVKVTGKKAQDKVYVRHSGYPGGLKSETFDKMIIRKPEFIIEHAVKGMLPGSKLGKAMIKKLKVFKGPAEGEAREAK